MINNGFRQTILYRIMFLALFICFIPIIPIFIAFRGFASPEYIFKGTLNLNGIEIQQHSIFEVYFDYLNQLIHLNFGQSIVSSEPVLNELAVGILNSASYFVLAFLIIILITLICSSYTYEHSTFSRRFKGQSFISTIPLIVISYIVQFLIYNLGFGLNSFNRILSASIVLMIIPSSVGINQVRKKLNEVSHSDFFHFHLACGFERSFIWDQLMIRIALIEILNLAEYFVIFAVAFSVFVEVPFNIQGIGFKFINAVHRLDYPVIIGFCIFQIVFLSAIGVVIEAIKMQVDPRHTNF